MPEAVKTRFLSYIYIGPEFPHLYSGAIRMVQSDKPLDHVNWVRAPWLDERSITLF